MSCQLCHDPVPALTDLGEQFAANGFRMSPSEGARDTLATGDDLLWLPKELPLAVRLDNPVTAEVTRDVEQEVTRASAGFVTGF